MSLVFRPKPFKDKNGDVIELEEMKVKHMDNSSSQSIAVNFDNGIVIDFYFFRDMQKKIEEQWNWGDSPLLKAKNISKDLRDKIRIFESLMESKGEEWTINEQLKLDMLREKLRKLQQEGEGEK